MSVDELQWYCDTHHSELDITERPCFLNDVCNPFLTVSALSFQVD